MNLPKSQGLVASPLGKDIAFGRQLWAAEGNTSVRKHGLGASCVPFTVTFSTYVALIDKKGRAGIPPTVHQVNAMVILYSWSKGALGLY